MNVRMLAAAIYGEACRIEREIMQRRAERARKNAGALAQRAKRRAR